MTSFTKLGSMLSKNSPTILTGLGVAGMITTVLLAVKATPKALSLIDDEVYFRFEESGTEQTFAQWLGCEQGYETADRQRKLTKLELLELSWKCYVPAAIMGVATIGCMIGANSINLRRNAALASVYQLSQAAIKEYQSKVIETIGANKHREIKEVIAKERMLKEPVSNQKMYVTGRGDTLCYDMLSGRYFSSNIENIKQVLNKLSRDMLSEHTVNLNQVYSELGLPETKLGDMVCWHVDDGLIEPNFSSQLTDIGEPCLVLDFYSEPRYHDFG